MNKIVYADYYDPLLYSQLKEEDEYIITRVSRSTKLIVLAEDKYWLKVEHPINGAGYVLRDDVSDIKKDVDINSEDIAREMEKE